MAHLERVQLAQDEGYRMVELKSNSKVAIDIISTTSDEDPYFSIIQRIRELLQKDRACFHMHTWKEGNQCANYLAKELLNVDSMEILFQPPEDLKELLNKDIASYSQILFVVWALALHCNQKKKKKISFLSWHLILIAQKQKINNYFNNNISQKKILVQSHITTKQLPCGVLDSESVRCFFVFFLWLNLRV